MSTVRLNATAISSLVLNYTHNSNLSTTLTNCNDQLISTKKKSDEMEAFMNMWQSRADAWEALLLLHQLYCDIPHLVLSVFWMSWVVKPCRSLAWHWYPSADYQTQIAWRPRKRRSRTALEIRRQGDIMPPQTLCPLTKTQIFP